MGLADQLIRSASGGTVTGVNDILTGAAVQDGRAVEGSLWGGLRDLDTLAVYTAAGVGAIVAAPVVAPALGTVVTSTAGATVGLWDTIKSAAGGVIDAGVDALKDQGGKIIQNALNDATARARGAEAGIRAAQAGADVGAGIQALAQNPVILAGGMVVVAVALSKMGD